MSYETKPINLPIEISILDDSLILKVLARRIS